MIQKFIKARQLFIDKFKFEESTYWYQNNQCWFCKSEFDPCNMYLNIIDHFEFDTKHLGVKSDWLHWTMFRFLGSCPYCYNDLVDKMILLPSNEESGFYDDRWPIIDGKLSPFRKRFAMLNHDLLHGEGIYNWW